MATAVEGKGAVPDIPLLSAVVKRLFAFAFVFGRYPPDADDDEPLFRGHCETGWYWPHFVQT